MSVIRHLQIDYTNMNIDHQFGYYETYQADRYNQSMVGYIEFYLRFIYDDYCNMVFANAVKKRCGLFMNMRERVYNARGFYVNN